MLLLDWRRGVIFVLMIVNVQCSSKWRKRKWRKRLKKEEKKQKKRKNKLKKKRTNQ